MSTLVGLATLAGILSFIWYAAEAVVQRSDRGELPSFRTCVNVAGKWIILALCIAIGVPLVIALIVLCFVFPPMWALPVIVFFLWAGPGAVNQPATRQQRATTIC